MTLFSTTSRIAYVGNGVTTTFAYPFRVLEAVELAVWVAGDRKGLGSHYSMTGVDTPTGGTVTLFATPAAGVSVVLQRLMPITQPVDLREHDALSAETQEREYDRLTMLIQGQEDDHAHMLRLADNSPTILPPGSLPEPELGKFLRWHDPTHLDNAEVVSAGSLSIGGNVAGRATFWTAPLGLGGDSGFCWNPAARRLTVARGMHEDNAPLTPHQDGVLFAFLKNSDNTLGYQGILAHVHNGAPTDTLSTLGNDKVAIAGWTKRGFGGTSPIYGGNFGVVFSTPGVANGVEIDCQNDSGVDFQGQGLWVNGSGGNHRANAILIDTQDSTKWQNGIKFTSNFGGGATGNVTNAGIVFDHNQSQTHILIVPFDDLNPSNNVFELRDSVFDQVRAGIQKRGAFAGRASATGFNDPTFTWTDSPRSGMYSPGIESLALTTNGFLRLAISDTGKVRIADLVGAGTVGVSVDATGTLIRGGAGGGGGGGGGPVSLVEIVPASGAAVGEMHYLELASFGTNYVGFKAPSIDVAANHVWALPATDGTNGQVLTTNGAHSLSWTTPAGGGGAGVTSVGGVAGVVGITNDANVTLTGASPNLVVGWAGTLSKARGGTGGAGGTNGQVGLWTLTGLTGDTGLSFDTSTQALRVGLTPTNPRALSVTSSTPVARFERSDSATATGSGTAMELVHTTIAPGGMGNGFDVLQNFVLRSASIDRLAAVIRVYRDGADTSHGFSLSTTVGGILNERLGINGAGQCFYTPTAAVGTFGFTAAGARRTEVQFFTASNAQNVSLIAPASATGNHIWTLPSTLGTVGQVLVLADGAGTMSWQTPSALDLLNLQVGPPPAGTQAAGPLKVTVSNADNVNPYQAVLAQVVNGAATVGAATIANDKVAVSGWAHRGAGGTSPVYAANFGIQFATAGVANSVEVGVINNSGTHGVGNGLWLNGNGANHRDNAILIDAQTSAKWGAGIKFIEGNVGAGASGSILNFGIIFDKSHDADFLVIRPRLGVGSNAAIRITDPTFSLNRFVVTNNGNLDAANVGVPSGGQYFVGGVGGATTSTKTLGLCTMVVSGGIITSFTGPATC